MLKCDQCTLVLNATYFLQYGNRLSIQFFGAFRGTNHAKLYNGLVHMFSYGLQHVEII